MFVDANNPTNTMWITGAGLPLGELVLGTGEIGPALVLGANSSSDHLGDNTIVAFNQSLVTGATGGAPFAVTWEMSGAFDTGAVSEFALYWGDAQTDPTAVLQSIGLAAAGSTSSAVPEPSTYAAMFGVCALGFAAWRRRRVCA